MKKFIASGLLVLSTTALAQSFMVLKNGVTLTTDKAAFVYDLSLNHMPSNLAVVGSNYMIDKEKLFTMNTTGNLFEKEKEVKPSKILTRGGNFLVIESGITGTPTILTIDKDGYLYELKEKKFAKPLKAGGNFLTVLNEKEKKTEIATVNSKGLYSMLTVDGLNPAEINNVGGRYFTTTSGKIFTVSSEGFIFDKSNVFKIGAIAKKGSNFFIDNTNCIFTISEEGFLMLPMLPMGLNIANVKRVGSNYFIDNEGKIYGVDAQGNIYARGTTTHDLREVAITTAF